VVNVKETEAGGLVEPPKNAEVYPIPLQPLPSRTSVMVVDGVWGGGVVKTILAAWMVVVLVVERPLGEHELALRGGGGSGGRDHDIVVIFEAGHREGGRRRRHEAVRPPLGGRGSALGRGRPWLLSLAAGHGPRGRGGLWLLDGLLSLSSARGPLRPGLEVPRLLGLRRGGVSAGR
jgi:hypothetical protein